MNTLLSDLFNFDNKVAVIIGGCATPYF